MHSNRAMRLTPGMSYFSLSYEIFKRRKNGQSFEPIPLSKARTVPI